MRETHQQTPYLNDQAEKDLLILKGVALIVAAAGFIFLIAIVYSSLYSTRMDQTGGTCRAERMTP